MTQSGFINFIFKENRQLSLYIFFNIQSLQITGKVIKKNVTTKLEILP